MADAEAHPVEIGPDMGLDGAQAVVAGMAAAGLYPELAWRQVKLVVENHDLVGRQTVEAHRFAERPAGLVHVGHRLQHHRPLTADDAVSGLALEAPSPGPEAMAARDRLGRHEADIVPVAA
jgi:hypothetical protein